MNVATAVRPAREAVVAGSFYPASATRLAADVRSRLGPRRLHAVPKAAFVPHAGYVYSGVTAGRLFGGIEIPERVVLIGPNHTGRGTSLAVDPSSSWTTPLGDVVVDEAARSTILAACPGLELDAAAHAFEHSLEVELPFLQEVRSGVKIVALTLSWAKLDQLRDLGLGLADAIARLAGPTLILVSTDMNHYEAEDVTRRKDERALEPLLALEPIELWRRVVGEGISMCGVVPAVVALFAAQAAGADRAELVDHRTSADAFGDRERTVGYASGWIS